MTQANLPPSLRMPHLWPVADRVEIASHRRQVQREGRPPMPLLSWAKMYRRFLVPDRVFDLESHPYLTELYRDDPIEAVFCKGGQLGLSELLISYAIWSCDEQNATVLYVFPTDTAVSDFSSARLGPAIEASEYLSGIVVEGNASSGRRGADRVTLKRVRNRFLYFRGAKVGKDGNAPQLKSIDADVLILDELDEMDDRAPSIARKRLGHSRLARVRAASTPSYAGFGVHAAYMESDQRRYFMPCVRCGHRQYLTINHVVTEFDNLDRPTEWHGKDEARAFAACEKCGAEMNRRAAGEWVAAYPGSDVVGYHIPKLIAPLSNLLEIVRNLQTVDETRRRETINQDLAEPYTPRGGALDDETLDACRRDYRPGPVAGERCYAGIDVGAVLHMVIRGDRDTETGERPLRFAGAVDWDEAGRLLRRYNVRTCVIDALPETTKAREFQAAFPRNTVWLAYYPNQALGSKRDDWATWDIREGIANLDRTRSLDETFSRFVGAVDDGDQEVGQENILYAAIRSLPDYHKHLRAPVRVLETDSRGQQVARYVEAGADHYAHAENYCTAASRCRYGRGWARGAA